MNKKLLVTAALSGFLAGSAACKDIPAQPKVATEGKCYGVNTCKGTGECATKDHGCGGMNSCKGQGWVKMFEQACLDKKGKFEAVKDGKFM